MKTVEVCKVVGLTPHFEYFCLDCGQLRLCCSDPKRNTCGNCGSGNLIKGKIDSLNKEKLKSEFARQKRRKHENR